MNAKETLKILSKQWIDIEDLKKLSGSGINTAYRLKKEIEDICLDKGYFIPNGLLPTNEVVLFLKIDIAYLKQMSEV